MYAIDTIEDLMQALDEHPQWLEAMRDRLLPRKLLELPQTMAELSAEVRSFAKTTKERLDGKLDPKNLEAG